MMKKGDTVFYVARSGTGLIVRAVVERAHKDGAARVRALFFVGDGGKDVGPYIGGTFELAAPEIFPNAMTADNARSAKVAAAQAKAA